MSCINQWGYYSEEGWLKETGSTERWGHWCHRGWKKEYIPGCFVARALKRCWKCEGKRFTFCFQGKQPNPGEAANWRWWSSPQLTAKAETGGSLEVKFWGSTLSSLLPFSHERPCVVCEKTYPARQNSHLIFFFFYLCVATGRQNSILSH